MEDVRYSLVGHKSRCFDVCFDRESDHLLSGSEDGSAKLWSVPCASSPGRASPRLLHSLPHSKEAEVLRVSMGGQHDSDSRLFTAGSDGKVLIWQGATPTYEEAPSPRSAIDLGDTQVYACEPMGAGGLLLGFEDRVAVYDTSRAEPRLVLDTAFTSSGAGFAGPRNPENRAFVFDAKRSRSAPSAVAVALSDGTVRVLDLRTASSSDSMLLTRHEQDSSFVIALGEASAHATHVAWSAGGLLAVALGSGHSCLFDLRMPGVELQALVHSCRGACFGGLFLGEGQLVTWGDDSVRLWDIAAACGEGSGARSIRDSVAEKRIEGYPVFGCALSGKDGCIAAAGGGSKAGFMGSPLHVLSAFG